MSGPLFFADGRPLQAVVTFDLPDLADLIRYLSHVRPMVAPPTRARIDRLLAHLQAALQGALDPERIREIHRQIHPGEEEP